MASMGHHDVTVLLHDNNPKTTGAPSEDLLITYIAFSRKQNGWSKKYFQGFSLTSKSAEFQFFSVKENVSFDL